MFYSKNKLQINLKIVILLYKIIVMIGEVIVELRKKKNLKQYELAEMVGITVNSLSSIERNKNLPRPHTLKEIARALGVIPEMIFLMNIKSGEIPEDKKYIFEKLKTLLLDFLTN